MCFTNAKFGFQTLVPPSPKKSKRKKCFLAVEVSGETCYLEGDG
jgi:hypothetical protein